MSRHAQELVFLPFLGSRRTCRCNVCIWRSPGVLCTSSTVLDPFWIYNSAIHTYIYTWNWFPLGRGLCDYSVWSTDFRVGRCYKCPVYGMLLSSVFRQMFCWYKCPVYGMLLSSVFRQMFYWYKCPVTVCSYLQCSVKCFAAINVLFMVCSYLQCSVKCFAGINVLFTVCSYLQCSVKCFTGINVLLRYALIFSVLSNVLLL